jgi:ribosomal RNA methyltransferase Nop2
VYDSQVPIGATPEYMAGFYMVGSFPLLQFFAFHLILLDKTLNTGFFNSVQLQGASSFLPVMALAPQEKERIIDMA